jgi:flagellar biosynthesis protein FlhG
MGKIIAITSGKGGVGKTMTTINMALAANKAGARVLIVDGDLGLSNVDVVMGLETKGHLNDVLDGHSTIKDIITSTKVGIDVISSGTGIAKLANMSPMARGVLVHELSRLPDKYDYVLLDTGAGISDSVLTLNAVSDLFVVVTTPEPHAITDAYAMIKVMAEEHDRHECALIVNQTINEHEGRRIAERIRDVAKQYSGSSVHFAGSVATDTGLVRAVLARRVGSDHALSSICGQGWGQAWCTISHLIKNDCLNTPSGGLHRIWEAMAQPLGERQFVDS